MYVKRYKFSEDRIVKFKWVTLDSLEYTNATKSNTSIYSNNNVT